MKVEGTGMRKPALWLPSLILVGLVLNLPAFPSDGFSEELREEPRFQHVSDLFNDNDGGWNCHIIVIGISGLIF